MVEKFLAFSGAIAYAAGSLVALGVLLDQRQDRRSKARSQARRLAESCVAQVGDQRLWCSRCKAGSGGGDWFLQCRHEGHWGPS